MKNLKSLLTYPFEGRVHPQAVVLENQVNLWLDDCHFLPESFRQKEQKIRVGHWVASNWPDAPYERLIPMARWFLGGFLHDDHHTKLPLKELVRVTMRIDDVWKGAAITPEDNEIVRQFGIATDELRRFAPPEWVDRYLWHNRLFFEGIMSEAYYNFKNIYPSVEEYIDIRDKTMGGQALCDLTEVASCTILPYEIYLHPTIQRIIKLSGYLMGWANDIYSMEKEKNDNETLNLVLVIQHTRNCTLESALKAAIQLHDDHLMEFLRLRSKLPDFHEHNEDVERYVSSIELMIHGHLIWIRQASRYEVELQ
ncbi:terpene synthase family protein [Olivibacter domesticus]|uniref:Terpene synthase n=1 Tax=Olivibacter domesticus TaxID=407022 RepID=A0A1H7KKN7_OLID1|nr:hypothetical protein [Olivibacter domesticus]SEK87348.1 hypothetical protein SAMN05661044_01387 [Olivibacter domesticus]